MMTAVAAHLFADGCAPTADPDPLAALNDPALSSTRHRRAMEQLDVSAPNDPETLKALEKATTNAGYSLEVREAALNRLAERDLTRAKTLVRRTLPQTQIWEWITRLSAIVAERGWTDLSPALVSSWARPTLYANNDLERPEYLALAKLHGAENVTDHVFETFLAAKGAAGQGLRTRCWELLHRLGQRQRLLDLLAATEVGPDDPMLIDLRAGAAELGIVPYNKEEILWLRELRRPERAEFWSRAAAALHSLPAERRVELELRDIPIVVSASLHEPELLAASKDELYSRVDGHLRQQRHHVQESNFEGFAEQSHQRLHEYAGKLTWGDLAAISIAVRAVQVPEVIDHLFRYAERDQADETTEYGGVIVLDSKDRFAILEFPPNIRRHDQEFITSQAMLDAAYTAIFHFHNHVQTYRNEKYAGPGFGDMNYADNLRANNLVFTFLNENTLNADFYRHGRVVIDLGEIKRVTSED